MSWYGEHVVPRLVDVACGLHATDHARRKTCAGLSGRVVEIGFGSGHNVPFYPPDVTHVDAVEPADLGWQLAQERVSASGIPIERSGLDGQALPFDDGVFDAALSTWTLCTIPHPETALREVRRVLKPGGTLHFVEHGLAPDEGVRRWQHRLEPLQKRLAGGCRLTRTIPELLTSAGFTITGIEQYYERGAPKTLGALSVGTAQPA